MICITIQETLVGLRSGEKDNKVELDQYYIPNKEEEGEEKNLRTNRLYRKEEGGNKEITKEERKKGRKDRKTN